MKQRKRDKRNVALRGRGKLITYQQLRDCYVFRYIGHRGGVRIYTKVSDAVALDERTGKDAIFNPNDRVEPLYPAAVDLV